MIAGILFVILIVIVFLSIAIGAEMRRRGDIASEAGNIYLVCSAKRGWHDFTRNNLLPVLPEHHRVIWRRSKTGGLPPVLATRFGGVPKPCMVLVMPDGLLEHSLNQSLGHLKQHPRKSEETRAACREIVARTEETLRMQAARPARA